MTNFQKLNSTEVDWTKDPDFSFETEVDGLMALQDLGDQLRAAREQVRQTMRYLQAAVRATDATGASPTAIINESGLARQTVYTMLGEQPA